ncbi:MAG: MCE family protein [Bacteroidetes bacterium]|nr:MCE family protein [Bacteroidota bacterium]
MQRKIINTILGVIIVIALCIVLFTERFSNYVAYKAVFSRANGIQASSQVLIKGALVGKIKSIDLEDSNIVVVLSVKKDIPLHKGTIAIISSGSTASGPCISLEPGHSDTILSPGDVLPTAIDPGTMPLEKRITPFFITAKYMIKTADSTIHAIDLFSQTGIITGFVKPLSGAEKSMQKYAMLSGDMNGKMDALGKSINNISTSANIYAAKSRGWDTSIKNMDNQLAGIAKDSLGKSLHETGQSLKKLSSLIKDLNHNNTTLNYKTTYTKTNTGVTNANQSAKEYKDNPPGFSIFGKSKKKKK